MIAQSRGRANEIMLSIFLIPNQCSTSGIRAWKRISKNERHVSLNATNAARSETGFTLDTRNRLSSHEVFTSAGDKKSDGEYLLSSIVGIVVLTYHHHVYVRCIPASRDQLVGHKSRRKKYWPHQVLGNFSQCTTFLSEVDDHSDTTTLSAFNSFLDTKDQISVKRKV